MDNLSYNFTSNEMFNFFLTFLIYHNIIEFNLIYNLFFKEKNFNICLSKIIIIIYLKNHKKIK